MCEHHVGNTKDVYNQYDVASIDENMGFMHIYKKPRFFMIYGRKPGFSFRTEEK